MYIDKTLYHGRPADCSNRSPVEVACYDLLDEWKIAFDRVDHDAAGTIACCHQVEQYLQAEICKNLFLCNRQMTQFYLLLMQGEKAFKTKDLSKQLGCSRLSFANAEQMQALLHITPGSVSVLGLMHDVEKKIQLVIDKPILQSQWLGCHPCINTSTLRIPVQALDTLFSALQHTPVVVDLPQEDT